MKTNKQLIYTLNFAEVGLKDISRVGGKWRFLLAYSQWCELIKPAQE